MIPLLVKRLNDFIENNYGAVQGYSNTNTNIFSNGTLVNYWSDYTGVDYNKNGIGDTPYSIDSGAGAKDLYPLMVPVDVTPPDLNSPSDVTYYEGSTGNTINWIGGDRHPGVYNVTLDGNIYITDSTWFNGTITVNVDGLSSGTHTVVISLYDTSGNFVSDSVEVTVTEVPTTTTPTTTTTSTQAGSFANIFLVLPILATLTVILKRYRRD